MSFRHPDDYIRNAPYDDPTIILVLVVMGQSADAEDGKLWPSVGTLAKRCRISERRLREIINTLIADGFIARKLRPVQGKRNLSNIYSMYLTEEAAARKASGITDAIESDTPCDPPHPLPATHRTHSLRPTAPTSLRPTAGESSLVNPQEKDQLESSLARSAQTSMPRESALPKRQTRERVSFDQSALERDPLTVELATCLGHSPVTRREWGQWRIAINDLHTAGATPDDIPRAIRGYQATYPKARVTPIALVTHWSEIQKGHPHDLAQLEISRRSAAADANARRERDERDAERKAAQQREVERMLSEWDDELREGESQSR